MFKSHYYMWVRLSSTHPVGSTIPWRKITQSSVGSMKFRRIALCLSPWALNTIDKLKRAFLWTGSNTVAGGRCKVAWSRVWMPKHLGGLGVSDLHRVGIALRVRWVCKARAAGVWPQNHDKAAIALFQATTMISHGNGESSSSGPTAG